MMAKKKSQVMDGFEELTSEMLPEDKVFQVDEAEETNLDESNTIDSHHKFSKFKIKGN